MRYIIKTLKKLNDPRQAWKIKHELADILAICIVAVMCGAQSSCEIQMSCEQDGIRMEVVSAHARGDTAEIVLTMQDLIGNRMDASVDLSQR